ncbi:hypothetical protein L9F63_026190, partial [Diploptera punctata]
ITSSISSPEETSNADISLQERLDEGDLEKIHEAIMKTSGEKLTFAQLKNLLRTIGGIDMNDDDFKVLFMKMDTKRDNLIDWDEFVSHILLEFQVKDAAAMQQSLTLPLEGYPKILRTNHRHPIVKITFCPAVKPDRTINYLHGKYLTASHEGAINYWSLDMELERSVKSESIHQQREEEEFLPIDITSVAKIICMTK